jgi:uncharacterized Zn finger protein
MTKRKKSIKQVDRAAQYTDSPLMTQRLRHGREWSARIDGNYGVYRTHVRLGRATDASCSCPSEGWPCKHVRALEATWKSNPASFFDLAQVLVDLAQKSKADLLKLIGKMAIVAPESLSACGVKAFQGDEADREVD